MLPLTEQEIRACFVNASKGEVRRMPVPADLDERPWDDLDYLGWFDQRAPLQAYLVLPTDDLGLVGLRLRRNPAGVGPRRARMCSLCLTTHPGQGVSLMVAPRPGEAGRRGNTVGQQICAGFECSGYARGLLTLPAMSAAHETLTVAARVERLQRNARAFVDRVMAIN